MAGKTVKFDRGTIYRKTEKSNWYFRYQINGERKTISLHTKNLKEAKKKAEEIIPLITASAPEVVAAHVQYAKRWKKKHERLEIHRIWETYEKHPERARPATQRIRNMYRAFLNDFISWLGEHYPEIKYMDEIRDVDEYGQTLNHSIVMEYADYLRNKGYAVDTHNKRIRRIAHIFRTLSKYLDAPSPWENPKLKRSWKEETGISEHRMPFPPDKEKAMFEAVKPESPLKLLNKHEIEVLLYILKYTGQRQKDCVNLSWDNIDMDRKRLWVVQAKTGKKVSIPIADELYEMLLKAKEWKTEDSNMVLPETAKRYALKAKDGTETGADLVNKQLLRIIKYVGLEPSVPVKGRRKKLTVYGVHSFRHSFASHCAQTGVPRAVCASILGADASIIDRYYVHIGEEAQRKAIEAISSVNENNPEKDRIRKALEYINSLPDTSKEINRIKAILSGE